MYAAGAMAASKESTLQARMLRLIDRLPGCWETKVHQSGYGRKGIPDILACMWGAFVAVEVKRVGGKVRPDQLREIEAIRDAGGVGVVLDDYNDFESLIVYVKSGMDARKINDRFPLPDASRKRVSV